MMKRILLLTIVLMTMGGVIYAKDHNFKNEDRIELNKRRSEGFKVIEQGTVFKLFSDGSIRLKKSKFERPPAFSPERRISQNYGSVYLADNNYIRYDYYGKLKRVGSTRIVYDKHNRVRKIGDLYVTYNRRGLVKQVGGMYVYYSRYNTIQRTEGVIQYRVCDHTRNHNCSMEYVHKPDHKKGKSKHYKKHQKKFKEKKHDD